MEEEIKALLVKMRLDMEIMQQAHTRINQMADEVLTALTKGQVCKEI